MSENKDYGLYDEEKMSSANEGAVADNSVRKSGGAAENADEKPVREYEISYNCTEDKYEYSSPEKDPDPDFPDSSSGDDINTDTSAASYGKDGYNAYGFNANGSGGGYGQTGRGGGKASFDKEGAAGKRHPSEKRTGRLMTAACVLLICSILIFALSCALFFACYKGAGAQDDSEDTTGKTNQNNTLWINPDSIDYGDAFSNASAKTVNSVVVITATSVGATSRASGVIWSSGSDITYILTCYHVIEGADEIKVTLNNDLTYRAEVVGVDARTDLAVISVDETGLPPIVLPNESTQLVLGQSVIAIGNALGILSNSVTDGILSSLERTVTVDGNSMELLQTTAAVNSGNSGGGLFDLNGQLIGIINAKKSGISVEGIGFAIPFSTCREVATQIISQGYVSGRPALGVETVTISDAGSWLEAVSKYPDLESYTSKIYAPSSYYYIEGVYVVSVDDDIIYADGGNILSFGDRVISVGGVSVYDNSDITSAVNNYESGDTIEITVMRKGKTVVVEVVLAEACA